MKIETARLDLRPYTETDLSDAFGVWGDPETMCFYPQPCSREQVEAIIRKNIDSFEHNGYGLFAVFETVGQSFVGDCGITIQHIDGHDEFEIGYRIHKSKWGLGFAPEAAMAILKYGFDTLDLTKLCSHMACDHTQSRRVAEKIGMTLEKEYKNPRNRDFLTAVYSIYND